MLKSNSRESTEIAKTWNILASIVQISLMEDRLFS